MGISKERITWNVNEALLWLSLVQLHMIRSLFLLDRQTFRKWFLLNRQFDRLGTAHIYSVYYFFQAQFDKPQIFFCLIKPSRSSFTDCVVSIPSIHWFRLLICIFFYRLIFFQQRESIFHFNFIWNIRLGLFFFTMYHFCWNDCNLTLWHLHLYMVRTCCSLLGRKNI